MMKKFIHDFTVIRNRQLSGNHMILDLLCPEPIPIMEAGQFAEVLVPNTSDVYLRRPFSIHDVDVHNNSISLFIKIVGKGTIALTSLREGEKINLVYPLGKGFHFPEHEKVLLIGGGCGVAPLLFLAHRLSDSGYNPDILIGARTADEIHEIEKYKQYGNLHLITEDGSLGEKGLVTHHSIFKQEAFSYKTVFACGPEGMLRAVNNKVKDIDTEVYVSLENTMACGIGACLCCVVQTTTGHRCVCTDGPVFNTKELAGW
jgi:dihydroorotate dehydrogenase electron transfer subunit